MRPRAVQDHALVNPIIAHAFAVPDAYMRACPHFGVPAPDPIENAFAAARRLFQRAVVRVMWQQQR